MLIIRIRFPNGRGGGTGRVPTHARSAFGPREDEAISRLPRHLSGRGQTNPASEKPRLQDQIYVITIAGRATRDYVSLMSGLLKQSFVALLILALASAWQVAP